MRRRVPYTGAKVSPPLDHHNSSQRSSVFPLIQNHYLQVPLADPAPIRVCFVKWLPVVEGPSPLNARWRFHPRKPSWIYLEDSCNWYSVGFFIKQKSKLTSLPVLRYVCADWRGRCPMQRPRPVFAM